MKRCLSLLDDWNEGFPLLCRRAAWSERKATNEVACLSEWHPPNVGHFDP